MALNFPSSPTLNQIFTDGTLSWRWNGFAWDSFNLNDTIKRFGMNGAKTYAYCGEAPSGSLESATVWTIVRYELNAEGEVVSEASANNVNWTDFLTHIYT
jgi:hypothetical protein